MKCAILHRAACQRMCHNTFNKFLKQSTLIFQKKTFPNHFGRFLSSFLCLYVWVTYMVRDHFSIGFLTTLLLHRQVKKD
jgi:hypothetical protein